jgi:hypothetical protein
MMTGGMAGNSAMMGNTASMGNSMTMQGGSAMPAMDPDQANDLWGFSILRSDPWWLLGWVVLFLVILALIAGSIVGIPWWVRQSRQGKST